MEVTDEAMARAGDAPGLVRRSYGPVLGLARRLLGDAAEARDAAQETFTRALARLRTDDPGALADLEGKDAAVRSRAEAELAALAPAAVGDARLARRGRDRRARRPRQRPRGGGAGEVALRSRGQEHRGRPGREV